jgi:putative mRNA 3-end processing factor
MAVRGARRRRSVDRGFVLSDHADWPGLNAAIAASGAGRVFVTHGQVAVMMRWLAAQGLDARSFETEFGGEEGASLDDAGAAPDRDGAASGSADAGDRGGTRDADGGAA